MEKYPCVYILASRRNGTLYVGVTSDLIKRVWEHKNDLVEGFTKRYRVHDLVWYEIHESMEIAIAREKAMKEWKRSWKIELIEKENPEWLDLYDKLILLDTGACPGMIESGVRRYDSRKYHPKNCLCPSPRRKPGSRKCFVFP
ncbi:GIY-YIG nuclease family protein [candidate division FCPU426 bacterium]|nr:GIY-YIG nuclease family protein [candidate division FCPU426 bacterium]